MLGKYVHGVLFESTFTRGLLSSQQESNFSGTAAFTVNVKLNERGWFSYLDVTRITARTNSVILVKSEALFYEDDIHIEMQVSSNTRVFYFYILFF